MKCRTPWARAIKRMPKVAMMPRRKMAWNSGICSVAAFISPSLTVKPSIEPHINRMPRVLSEMRHVKTPKKNPPPGQGGGFKRSTEGSIAAFDRIDQAVVAVLILVDHVERSAARAAAVSASDFRASITVMSRSAAIFLTRDRGPTGARRDQTDPR